MQFDIGQYELQAEILSTQGVLPNLVQGKSGVEKQIVSMWLFYVFHISVCGQDRQMILSLETLPQALGWEGLSFSDTFHLVKQKHYSWTQIHW